MVTVKRYEYIRVVLIDARIGNLERSGSQGIRPSERPCVGVIGAVDIMLIQDRLTVRRGCFAGNRGWRRGCWSGRSRSRRADTLVGV
jgi:hypothetical protein